MKNKIRKHFIFSGSVQGVGFRYTAQHIAQMLGITGWVYNEFDGTVIMEAQGSSESISKMIEMIGKSPFIYIEKIEEKDVPIEEWERSFSIKRGTKDEIFESLKIAENRQKYRVHKKTRIKKQNALQRILERSLFHT